jgi:hypothetical protein
MQRSLDSPDVSGFLMVFVQFDLVGSACSLTLEFECTYGVLPRRYFF